MWGYQLGNLYTNCTLCQKSFKCITFQRQIVFMDAYQLINANYSINVQMQSQMIKMHAQHMMVVLLMEKYVQLRVIVVTTKQKFDSKIILEEMELFRNGSSCKLKVCSGLVGTTHEGCKISSYQFLYLHNQYIQMSLQNFTQVIQKLDTTQEYDLFIFRIQQFKQIIIQKNLY
ncbi:unnamed protein product [Paramecium primaurelia]|uniref:Uncharacterized protein n=1 Tax=Paramecium primaurelia TaxID=5886 RepID=A0A8S1M7Y8_PARPR|nr:unnamed protein product [Paramecium primaurelia]